jgi:hypothetical protein
VQEVLLEGRRHRGLARGREACKPQCEALLPAQLVALAAREGRVPGNVAVSLDRSVSYYYPLSNIPVPCPLLRLGFAFGGGFRARAKLRRAPHIVATWMLGLLRRLAQRRWSTGKEHHHILERVSGLDANCPSGAMDGVAARRLTLGLVVVIVLGVRVSIRWRGRGTNKRDIGERDNDKR